MSMTPDQEREQAIRERWASIRGDSKWDDIPWLLDRLTEERERQERAQEALALELAWKSEAMLVLAEYDAIADLVPGQKLGSSKMENLRNFVDRALLAALRRGEW